MHLAPLLNATLPLDLPENDFTTQLAGEVRADNIHKLLVALLQVQAQAGSLLLILRDGHWLDSAS